MNLQKIEPGIQKLVAGNPKSQSADRKAENIATLKVLFPELLSERMVDGKTETAINVDVLKQLVGDTTASDADEKYGLNWHGKRRARQIALRLWCMVSDSGAPSFFNMGSSMRTRTSGNAANADSMRGRTAGLLTYERRR